MSWPHQMWRPFSVVSTVANEGLKLPEGEEPGQTPLLSQDCYAAPGLPISAIGGGGPTPPPPSADSISVSTFTANPAQILGGMPAAVVTGALRITDDNVFTSVGLQLAANTFVSPAASKAITFETINYSNTDSGVAALRATTWTDAVGDQQTGLSVEMLSTARIFAANASLQTLCNSVYSDELITSDMTNISSINGVSWASISTAAGTLG